MYKLDNREPPNFIQISKLFDLIDIRKHGEILAKEWLNFFGIGKEIGSKISANGESTLQNLYCLVNKNKKILQEKANQYLINGKIPLVEFINVLSNVLNGVKEDQLKIIANIGDKNKNGKVDLELFFRLIKIYSKKISSHPNTNRI